jgi:hypothetical protein
MKEEGDHILFVAGVEGGEVIGGTPLMYYKRTYAGWTVERPAPAVEGAGG